jgi:hypothetical protein
VEYVYIYITRTVDANNYLTLSAFGVTHFIDGQPSFTDLERWQWEHRTFIRILQLNVFRKFRVWKVCVCVCVCERERERERESTPLG